MIKPLLIVMLLVAAIGSQDPARGHDVVTTKLTWSKEVSRVIFARCAGCHRPEGKAFSLLKYEEARPWAKAISEEVLRRRMPPWNAVKGFGEFNHDQGLSEEEIHLLADWVEGGAPEGDPNLLPPAPRPAQESSLLKGPRLRVLGSLRFSQPAKLRGIEMGSMPAGKSFKLIAEQPDGTRLPLIWIEGYSPKAAPVYEFREPIAIAAGTKIVAYPAAGVVVRLITSPGPAR